jgi:hypothetical protein
MYERLNLFSSLFVNNLSKQIKMTNQVQETDPAYSDNKYYRGIQPIQPKLTYPRTGGRDFNDSYYLEFLTHKCFC